MPRPDKNKRKRTPIRQGRNGPIGVFDSGLGGLTVVKELQRVLPGEDIVYFGDTARVPYGTKSKESIVRFSLENTRILLKDNVKLVVVACNSSSSYALPSLRKAFDVPIMGVVRPGAFKAVELTRNKKVGVIATAATIQSKEYAQQVRRVTRTVRVFSQACPLFVPLVEEGWSHKDVTLTVAQMYLSSLKERGVDTLILGCTHYPLLKKTLAKVMGAGVTLVDSAREVALEVRDVLRREGLDNQRSAKGRCRFLVSDKPQAFQRLARNFLGQSVKVEKISTEKGKNV